MTYLCYYGKVRREKRPHFPQYLGSDNQQQNVNKYGGVYDMKNKEISQNLVWATGLTGQQPFCHC